MPICRRNVQKRGIASTKVLRPKETSGVVERQKASKSGWKRSSSIRGQRGKKRGEGEAKVPGALGFTLNGTGSCWRDRIILAAVLRLE